MTLADVLTRLDEFPACRLVQVTGGEPLLQDGSISLLQALLDQGKEVLLETSGSVSLARVPVDVVRIVDLKPPGSGEVESNLWENIELLVAHDEVKCVLRDRVDYDWAVDRVQRHGLLDRVAAVHFSPVFGELDPATLTSWVLQDGLGVRVNLQLHKLIWDPTARGV